MFDISHIYNVNDALTYGNAYGLGVGWRTNYHERLYQGEFDCYIWEDSDGTEHHFSFKSGAYRDEDGLELTLHPTVDIEAPYYISDKLGNRRYFDNIGRLIRLTNNQQAQSEIKIIYNSSDWQISRIEDGIDRKYNFTYTDDLLTEIVYTGAGSEPIHTVSFSYENSKLTAITDADSRVCRYYYTANGILTSVKDISSIKLTYTYNTPTEAYQPYRVQKVAEWDYSDAIGSWVEGSYFCFAYAQNQTTITDHNENVQVLQFNNWGDITAVYDDEGRGQFFRYATDSNSSGTPHQLRSESDLQTTVVNMLSDSSFENREHDWVNTANVSGSYIDSADSGYGDEALFVEANGVGAGVHEDTYTLSAGETITFSAYVKSETATVSVMLFNWADNPESKRVTTGSQWERLEVSYTNDTQTDMPVSPHILAWDSGLFLVDSVQLEFSPTASRYNLIDNGDFNKDFSYAWNRIDGYTQTASAFSLLSNKVYKLSGTYTGQNSISQVVDVNGEMDDTFILAGWGKGNSVPFDILPGSTDGDTNTRAFGLRARFIYDTETERSSPYFGIDFNPGVENWQYAATQIKAPENYECIEVLLVYDYGANNVYFDGIQLYEGKMGTRYTYYPENNKLATVVEPDGNKTQYTYYSNGDLHTVLEPSGVYTTYNYDAYHNIKKIVEDTSGSISDNFRTIHKYEYDAYGNKTSEESHPDATSGTKSSYSYSTDGNRLVSVTDTAGNVTRYGYDADTNMLNWVRYPEDTYETRTNYSYDEMFHLVVVSTISDTNLVTNSETYVYYGYSGDRLTEILTPNSEYYIEYTDLFDQRQSVKVGSNAHVNYQYTNDANRYLSSVDFRNGDMVYYNYDKKGRLIKETFGGSDTVAYIYDGKDNLVRMVDSRSGITTSYYYDELGRQIEYAEKGTNLTHSVSCTYDEIGNPWLIDENINGTSYNTEYIYGARHRVNEIIAQVSNTSAVNTVYHYDDLDRVLNQYIQNIQYDPFSINSVFYKSFTYVAPTGTDGGTTRRVETYKITIPGKHNITYGYSYDTNGNITQIDRLADDGSVLDSVNYVYDSLNQLVREDNQAGGYTYTWEYDYAGNILCRRKYAYTTGTLGAPTATVTYSYAEETSWGDILTKYNGKTVTYDGQGRLLNDGSWQYAWTHGRELATMTNSTAQWSFSYNTNGLRTQRTNGTKTYKYIYDGTQLRQMTVDGHTLRFTYDAEGSPVSLTYDGITYYYVTNLQGDVIAILNGSRNQVASYIYDAWGNVLNAASIPSNSLASINPLRYRGYVYDKETKLYYLQSRYYNPLWGRFISADNVDYLGADGTPLSYNLFAYCSNNPINMSDPDGNLPKWANKLIAAVAVVAVVTAVAAVTVVTAGAGTAAAVIAVGAAKGAAVGMASGAAIGAATGAVSHRVSTGSWKGAGAAILNGIGDGALSGAATGAITGAAGSALKVSQAAKAWDSGTFRSGYQSMKYHYNKHVVSEGLTKGNNVLKYTQDAVSFANRNSSVLKYAYNYNYGNASWNLTYSTGQGGMFTSAGKIFTFWYR